MDTIEKYLQNTTKSLISNKLIGILSNFGIPYEVSKIKYTGGVENYISNLICTFNRLEDFLPTTYNIKYDGQIKTGKLINITLKDIIELRDTIIKENFTKEDYSNIFITLDIQLEYCEDNQGIYRGIPKNIGEYLYKNNLSHRIYNLASKHVDIPDFNGERAKVFDMYIQKEKSITAKKYMMQTNCIDEDIDSDYWALYYVSSILSKPPVRIYGSEAQAYFWAEAGRKDLSEADLKYRYTIGYNMGECIKMGIQDSKTYGIKSTHREKNQNFIAYLNYLADNSITNK